LGFLQSKYNLDLKTLTPQFALRVLEALSLHVDKNEIDMDMKIPNSSRMWKIQINKLNRHFNYLIQQGVKTFREGVDFLGQDEKGKTPGRRGLPGLDDEGGPASAAQKTSAGKVWRMLAALPNRRQIMSPIRFKDLAYGKSGEEYFMEIRKKLRDVQNEWNKIGYAGMKAALGSGKANRAKAFLSNYYATVKHILENSEKYFTRGEKTPSIKNIEKGRRPSVGTI
jgi:hypothetical protein